MLPMEKVLALLDWVKL